LTVEDNVEGYAGFVGEECPLILDFGDECSLCLRYFGKSVRKDNELV